MDVESEILRQGKRIDEVLEALIPRPAARAQDELEHLSEPIWYHMETGGKRIRPALCLITCEALGGDSQNALHFATAVELLHNMFLLHDDIADGDEIRRDKPAVWKRFGLGNGVNAGDYMLGLALKAVTDSPVAEPLRMRLMEIFLSTYLRTVQGQALDINARCDARFSVERYLKISELKTGRYLVLGMVGGALIAGAPEVTIRSLHKLGESMGPAFQIRDDLIDLTIGKGRGGVKGSDIREGKASVLYAHALVHSMPAEQEPLLEIMAKPRSDTTDEDVQWVLALYERCGSIAFARETADGLIHKAHETLDDLPTEQQPPLRALATYMAERNR